MVPAAGGGLVDGHPLAVIEVQDLVAQGELPDQGVPERLAVAAPPPDIVPRPQPGEFGARGEQLADQRAQVPVAAVAAEYLGAIASASLIGLCYGRQATDAGLHRLAVILVIAAAALLAVTLADRALAPSNLEACSGQ